MHIIGPVVVTLVVAAAFGISIVAVSDHNWWRFWGSLYGSFTTVAVFGLALWGFNRRRGRPAQIGRRILMGTLTLFGLAVAYWIVLMGGGSPFSLEGMWIYPLAIVPLAIVALMFASRRRSKREGLWERPPGASQ